MRAQRRLLRHKGPVEAGSNTGLRRCIAGVYAACSGRRILPHCMPSIVAVIMPLLCCVT